MGIFDWIFRKGLAGAISTDLIINYLAIRSQYSNEEDKKIVKRVWGLWLYMNEAVILSENDEHKTVRLQIIKEQHDGKTVLDTLTACETLFDLYKDILYIETEISIEDGKLWDRAMRVFLHTAKGKGLDFEKEYNSYKRVIERYLGS
jgi:hypothetical protein